MFEVMLMSMCVACMMCLAFAFFYNQQRQDIVAAPAMRNISASPLPLISQAPGTTPTSTPKATYSASLTATNCKDARPAANAVEETFRLYVQQRGREFVTHLKNSKHASDPRAQALIVSWSGLIHIFSENTAKFNYVSGCFSFNPSAKNLTRARMNTKLIHEFAHSTCCAHEAKWQSTFTYFLNIATAELGWICDADCGMCQKYGMCMKSDCPKCNWTEDPAKCTAPYWTHKTCTTTQCEE